MAKDATKAKVDQLIADKHVFIASKSYCPFCKQAKKVILDKYNATDSEVLELDELDDGAEIQAYLAELTGQRTVPNVFIDGKHIGGCDSVLELDRDGGLKPLLAN